MIILLNAAQKRFFEVNTSLAGPIRFSPSPGIGPLKAFSETPMEMKLHVQQRRSFGDDPMLSLNNPNLLLALAR